jgi:hypothetical protein
MRQLIVAKVCTFFCNHVFGDILAARKIIPIPTSQMGFY